VIKMAFNFKNLFSTKNKTIREEENKNFNAIPVLEKTNKIDLAAVISRRNMMNVDKLIDVAKTNEEIEKYKQMVLNYKKKGATERQLENLKQKIEELVIERQKMEVLMELLNQDNLVKTAFGKKRQAEIHNTLLNRYKSGEMNLIDFKENLAELSLILKSRTDERNETQKLEDFNARLY
jgi:hypothetical protein